MKIRLSDEELATIRANAEAYGWSVKAYVANAALQPPPSDEERASPAFRALSDFDRTYRHLFALAKTLNATAAAVNTAAKRDDLANVAEAVKDLPQLLRLVREISERTVAGSDRLLAEYRSRRRRRRR
jgi:hypothetical protein